MRSLFVSFSLSLRDSIIWCFVSYFVVSIFSLLFFSMCLERAELVDEVMLMQHEREYRNGRPVENMQYENIRCGNRSGDLVARIVCRPHKNNRCLMQYKHIGRMSPNGSNASLPIMKNQHRNIKITFFSFQK